MKITFSISLIIIGALIATSVPATVSADPVDCDEMIENCQDDNPFSELFNHFEHLAFDMGCEAAGSDCRAQQLPPPPE